MTEAYLPKHGDGSFDVNHYDLDLAYVVDGNQLTGKARLEATALEELDRIELDLHKLHVSKVIVDGHAVARHSHRHGRLMIKLKDSLLQGEDFVVTISYRGKPRPAPGIDGEAGWEELSDGSLVAAQPDGAPSWFPCNDKVSNKASYRIQVTAASEYVVVANGQLTQSRRKASGTTWTFEQREPMATYLATVQIGRYVVRPSTGSGSVPVQEIYPAAHGVAVKKTFQRQPEMIKLFGELFGPYPFQSYAVVVTDDDLEIPIEAQGLSIFGANYLGTGWEMERLVAHELAHQWFGNSLTLRHWSDIWLHEGFACYAEWLWSEESGGASAAEQASEHWVRQSQLAQDLVLGDPGPELMFDDRIYKRGALLLQALRLTIGDATFFELLRTWVQQNAYGSVDTAMFIDLAERVAEMPLGDLFRCWLAGEALPHLPGAA